MLMTSKMLPDEITGRDLLFASKHENPTFYEYTHVLVPYCSSDLWLGLKTNLKEPFHFVNDSAVDNFSFRGHTIFRSVFLDLLQQYNLSDAEEIILSGSSAGGVGVLNHAGWVLNKVIESHGLNANLFSIVDSGWFIDFQGSLTAKVRPGFTSFANITSRACMDFSHGHTCCPSASCMIARGYYPSSVPLLLVTSMYDVYMFGDVLRRLEDEGKTVDDNSADYLSVINMYGGAMNESLTLSENQASNVSVFVPACFQHIYFCTSSLWDENGVFPPSAEVARGTGKFSHKIKSGIWESTKIVKGGNSTTIKKFIAAWFKSHGSPMSLIDSCIGAQCNPTCPGQLLFIDPGAVWGQTVKTAIIGLCLVITVLCVGLKTIFVLQRYYLGRKQRQFLRENERSVAEKELPPCTPHEAISIACLSLSYSVDVTKKTKTAIGDTRMEDEVPREEPPKTIHVIKEKYDTNLSVLEEEDSSSSDDSDSIVLEKVLQPRSLPAENLGFDITSEEAASFQNGIGCASAELTSPSMLLESGKHREEESGKHLPRINNGVTHKSVHVQQDNNFTDVDGHSTVATNDEEDGREPGQNMAYCLPDIRRRSRTPEVDYVRMDKSPPKNQILNNVSVYFNPGELVAIMGPSGCGKTTLLDLLTGRRTQGHSKGHVYINGVGLGRVQDWYSRKIGYVLQLAVPYYEELTVRQNLFFAAHMRLPKSMSHSRKFERVEQILAETGLTPLADTVVGGSVGQGLSGGQKRRLCVALQMVNLPAVLFLDEPTSGLDASSSLELLNHLNLVAESGRLVILTIHQPRLEIFHLFHKILLLCDGQVAYYGDPSMAPTVFLKAYIQSTTEEFRRSENAPNIDAKNPADTIMDLLNCSQARRAILDYYQRSGEPQAVQEAIKISQNQARNTFTLERMKNKKKNVDDAGTFNRIFVLEDRTSERQTLGQIIYFPFIFFMFGVIVGTVYWQAEGKDGILLMSAFCVYCCASPLFLSSVLMAHLNKALDIFHLERADGCGRSHENVIQTYVRTAALCVIPVLVCSVMTYFMVMTSYDLWKFVLVTIISLVLNQTWIAVYMMVICAHPGIAHRICPMVSAIGGFAGGFLVPRPSMPVGYNLLFYINPQFYGYSAITKVLLQNVRLKCEYESTLNCIATDGNAVLARFGFDTVNIYENLAIMLGMTVLSLILSWLFLEAKYVNTRFFTKSPPTFKAGKEEWEATIDTPAEFQTASRRRSTLKIVREDNGLHTVILPREDGIEEVKDEESQQEIERKISRLSRRARWQSTKQRTEDRKNSTVLQMKNIRKISAEEQFRRDIELQRMFRSNTFPTETEEKVKESRGRTITLCNPGGSSYIRLQESRLKGLTSEQSETGTENNQMKTENDARQIYKSEEHEGARHNESYDSEENMADYCVELDEITVNKQDGETNSKEETRF
ncbi:hypothetical protein ACROYT_G036177 [Oculina patagonica]